MSKVLVAIDGSEYATRALIDAVALFGSDAEYVMASVVPSSLMMAVFGGDPGDAPAAGTATHGTATGSMPFAPTPDVDAQQRAYDYFREAQAEAAAAAGIEVAGVIEEARPRKRRIGRAICDIAAEQEADVIVLGSHGSSYAGEALLGSVSQFVLHNAVRPVLVTRSSE